MKSCLQLNCNNPEATSNSNETTEDGEGPPPLVLLVNDLFVRPVALATTCEDAAAGLVAVLAVCGIDANQRSSKIVASVTTSNNTEIAIDGVF